jgi:hypothetical protein
MSGAAMLLRARQGVRASASAPPSGAAPFFQDSFAGVQFNNANGFTWGGQVRTSIVTFDGAPALRFRFGPDSSSETSRAESRWNLGRNVSALWIEYECWYPSNYLHRADGPGSNNKLIRIWGDDYGAANKVGASTWISGSYGAIRVDRIVDDSAVIGPGTFGGLYASSPTEPFLPPRGEWCTIRVYSRMVSALDANDARFAVFVNGTPWIDWSNLNAFYDSSRPYWNAGYFLGAPNSGFTDETDIYFRNVKFYDTDPGWPA